MDPRPHAPDSNGAGERWIKGPRLAALGVLGGVLAAGCHAPPTAQYRGGYQQVNIGDTSQDIVNNLLEVSGQDQFAEASRYRWDLRTTRTDTRTTTATESLDQTQSTLRPTLEMVLGIASLQWLQGYEYFGVDRSSSAGFDASQTRTDVLQRIVWDPYNLPKLTAWIDARKFENFDVEKQSDNRAVFELQDARGPFTLDYSLEMRNRGDATRGIDRDLLEHILRGTYREDHMDGQLSTSLSLFLNDRDFTDSFPTSGGGEPSDQVFPQEGLSVVDPTPQVAVLAPTPSLIDGDQNTPTGINIGGLNEGGQTDWNIGVEFQQVETSSLALLYTQEEVPPLFLLQYSFSVWTSEDNNFWTLASPSVAFTYESTFNRFRILLPDVTGRFLKLVCEEVPPLATAILVTELETFSQSGGGSGTGVVRRVDDLHTGTANVTWRPVDSLTMGANLFAATRDRSIDGEANQDETRYDLGLNATWSPFDIVDLSLRFLDRDIDDPLRFDSHDQTVNGLLTVAPLPTFDVSLRYFSNQRDVDGQDERDNVGAGVLASAQILEDLRADLGYERNSLEDFGNLRQVDRDIVTASLVAQITRALSTNLTVLNDSATVSGLGTGVFTDPSSNRTNLFIVYQPSNQLTTEVRLTWRDDAGGDGLDQRYRIDWLPFVDGDVDIQLDFLHRVDGVLEEGSNIYRLLTRWNITPGAFFQFNYSVDVPTDSDTTELLTMSLNVSV